MPKVAYRASKSHVFSAIDSSPDRNSSLSHVPVPVFLIDRLGRARLQPCRQESIKMRALAPEGSVTLLPPTSFARYFRAALFCLSKIPEGLRRGFDNGGQRETVLLHAAGPEHDHLRLRCGVVLNAQASIVLTDSCRLECNTHYAGRSHR